MSENVLFEGNNGNTGNNNSNNNYATKDDLNNLAILINSIGKNNKGGGDKKGSSNNNSIVKNSLREIRKFKSKDFSVFDQAKRTLGNRNMQQEVIMHEANSLAELNEIYKDYGEDPTYKLGLDLLAKDKKSLASLKLAQVHKDIISNETGKSDFLKQNRKYITNIASLKDFQNKEKEHNEINQRAKMNGSLPRSRDDKGGLRNPMLEIMLKGKRS